MKKLDNIKKIFKKITGISTPLGGISWAPTKNEKDILYNFIIKMSNRRLLSRTHGGFQYKDALNSLNIIRENITKVLMDLGPNSSYKRIFLVLLEYYKRFQTTIENEYKNNNFRDDVTPSENLIKEWGEIKEKGGLILGAICYVCDMEAPRELLISYNVPKEIEDELKGKFI